MWFSYYREIPEIRNFELYSNVYTNIFSNPNYTTSFSNSISGFVILLLVYFVFKPDQKTLFSIVILEIILLSLDQLRWQPYVFQFILTFLFYVISKKRFLTFLIILLSATYFYSGIHKLNSGFIAQTWQDFILNRFLHLPENIINNLYVSRLGYFLGLIELALGVLILFNKRFFVGILIMHFFIILLIGPLGININSIILPWNFLLFTFALFYMLSNYEFQYKVLDKKSIIVFLIVFTFPILNFLKLQNPYFSFEMFSGKFPVVIVETKDKKLQKYKVAIPIIKKHEIANNHFLMPLSAYIESKNIKANIPPFVPVYKNLANKLKQEKQFKNARFYLLEFPYKNYSLL